MSAESLLAWQWSDYPAKHRSRANLLIHIVAVPLFQLATLVLIYGALQRSALLVIIAAGGLIVALGLQGRGHRLEPEAPAPFRSPGDAVRRIIAEQWITFPRFVVSGAWWRNLRGARGTSRTA